MENTPQPTEMELALQKLEQAAAEREAAARLEQERAAAAAEAEKQAAEWAAAEAKRRAESPEYDLTQKIHDATELGRRASVAQLEITAEIDRRATAGEIAVEDATSLKQQVATMGANELVQAHASQAHVTTLDSLAYKHAKSTGRSFAPNVPPDPASVGLNNGGTPAAPGKGVWESLGLSAASIEKLQREFQGAV